MMHTVHTSAVSTSNAPSGGVPLPKQKRYSSRSNSFSSASIVTVKRAGSISSTSTGARSSGLPIRAQSPGETSLIALRVGRDQMSQDHKRRRSVAIDPTERSNGEGSGGPNRWSHSTRSSMTSAGHARNRASSGAVLPGLAEQSFSPQKKSTNAVEYSPRASVQKRQRSRPGSEMRQSPHGSPVRDQRRPSRPEITALPPLRTTPALTDSNESELPSSNQASATSTGQSEYGQDHFADINSQSQAGVKSNKPSMARNYAAPLSAVNSSRMMASDIPQDAATSSRPTNESPTKHRLTDSRNVDPRPSTAKESSRHKRSRTRERGEKDKKAMLAKALQKANTAVQLDNAQNFEGALDAYGDACMLLQQVMDQSSGFDDKRKLDAIRVTYTTRIDELRQIELTQPDTSDEKELPARPMSDDSMLASPVVTSPTIDTSVADAVENSIDDHGSAEQAAVDETTPLHVVKTTSPSLATQGYNTSASDIPRDAENPKSTNYRPLDDAQPALGGQQSQKLRAEDRGLRVSPLKTNVVHLPPPESDYTPAPLSPRRPASPQQKSGAEQEMTDRLESSADRENSGSGAPWLDRIDESASSRASSVHSVSSQQGLRRKHIRGASGDTNPDFDAAFDAAVEAAYDEGLEPDLDEGKNREIERKNHAPTDSIAVRSSEIQEMSPPTESYRPGLWSRDDADEEEERLLDDITSNFSQTFNFDLATKSALPRQSDSSGYSRSTWQSSLVSDRTTAGTSLSTVAEDTLSPPHSKNAFATSPPSLNTILAGPPHHPPPSAPPPESSLPKLPTMSQPQTSGVRNRRLSGQNLKQLKIETSTSTDTRKRASTFHHNASPFKEEDEPKSALDKDFKFGMALEPVGSDPQHDYTLKSPPSLDLRSAVSDTSRPMTATTATDRQSFDDEPGELIKHKPTLIRKNKSSVSLREHMVLLSSPTVENGPFPFTPMSSTFMTFESKRKNETPLTSQRATLPSFGPTAADSLYSGGVYLFDTSLSASHMPTSPKSPDLPIQLEPCPESFLLRPFWLMRNVATSLTHPKGGFLTQRLFVPREVWQTKGVKLKSVEDKIAGCDLLTAALGRLAGVDTYDADAVMEELQNFEDVMERVQNTFVKRLGSDVGISGLPGLFKDAAGSTTAGAGGNTGSDISAGADKTRSKEGKGYLNSWRKLRSKSSGAPVARPGMSRTASTVPDKEGGPTMPTVPMTSFVPVERRGHKKDIKNTIFDGPNREYMSSLVRLFDGVQALDQIARQVEDPGLKGTSQTHVGLELSIRHAAEFFGFYICRFVLIDIGIMIDKFVKRGTEWALA